MNEEENCIKELKEFIEYFYSRRPNYNEVTDEEIWNFENVLKLIEKQQKELENLNREMTDFNDMWLHKDKIRKLIDEIDRGYANRAYTAEDMIDVLKELL